MALTRLHTSRTGQVRHRVSRPVVLRFRGIGWTNKHLPGMHGP